MRELHDIELLYPHEAYRTSERRALLTCSIPSSKREDEVCASLLRTRESNRRDGGRYREVRRGGVVEDVFWSGTTDRTTKPGSTARAKGPETSKKSCRLAATQALPKRKMTTKNPPVRSAHTNRRTRKCTRCQ
ncbi:hypothetical protein GLAREA_00264 [Glarea lozoyensis ATCC 20868]|uniref:Uncharacterized protein n=1 Tax=Glarea lozoyensis (strain ATCC 20868 / MF5171) TaxID=1116229 RepID=S3DAU6_GLAL2|nr:uncharacterized protein GLAREA_00264 [Glarea lozoyensis ATCC 20868]EPE29106.1 hypothetical protein GLAREA_00264 [Glarea lozoyensis ATCC 20868]